MFLAAIPARWRRAWRLRGAAVLPDERTGVRRRGAHWLHTARRLRSLGLGGMLAITEALSPKPLLHWLHTARRLRALGLGGMLAIPEALSPKPLPDHQLNYRVQPCCRHFFRDALSINLGMSNYGISFHANTVDLCS